MKTSTFVDLGIVSAKKPVNTHLLLELNSGILYLVDVNDPTKMYYSDDKGDNWTQLDIDPSDSSGDNKSRDRNIASAWHDRANEIIWFVDCDNDGVDDTFDVWTLDYSGSETAPSITEIDSKTSAGNDDIMAHDIFIIGVKTFVLWDDNLAVGGLQYCYDVSASPFVETDSLGVSGLKTTKMVVVGTIAYFLASPTAGATFVRTGQYDDSIETISYPFVVNHNYFVKTDQNYRFLSYDGNDFLKGIVEADADGKNYLIEFSIGGDAFTIGAEHNVILMLDRNNVGTAPNELEKGFSIDATETVYEIKARRGGIRILQNCSNISDAVLIAITDNFLMNNDGDMFEFTDVTNEISSIFYNDGIIGVKKKGVFTTHPDFHINWSKKDSIKIYDDNDVLEFHGIITNKNQNRRGIYVFKIDSFTNEIYRRTYNKTYSADDTDTKQKDIIDNACDFCYRSSSIVGTTTTYDYVYNRAIVYLFWLARFLERQVSYVEADGKIWTKAYDGLVATGKSWDINDNSQEVFLIDIPNLAERLPGFFDGNSGVTRNTVRYKNNASTIRPVAATRDPIEQLQGIQPLNEFRDPKLEAATEANQLGDNRYNIWSIDTIFLGLRIQGEGYLQPGKTIQIQNTGQIAITQHDFLIISFQRDPKNDVYINMVLSDNIIFPTEFNNLQDTTITQVHTASVQAIENQSDLATHAGVATAHQDAPALIATHAADGDAHHEVFEKLQVIKSNFFAGNGGFVPTVHYGAAMGIALSDTSADFRCSYYIEKGGSFKVRFIYHTTGPNAGKTAGGIIYVSHDRAGDESDWDILAQAFNLVLANTHIMSTQTYGTAFTVADDTRVGVLWSKNDNAGGALASLLIYEVILERQ